jgi:hypothetical protein
VRPPHRLRTRGPRRVLAGAAALTALALGASACDVSPYAAKVGSNTIKVTALNSELKAWSSNQAYVTAFDSANSSNAGGSGASVVGDAPGTYGSAWVASILTEMIDSVLVRQHLVATRSLPDQAAINAARTVSEISQIGWPQFSLAFRQTLVQRLADISQLGGSTTSPTIVRQAYDQYRANFFSKVCVVEATAFTQPDALVITASPTINGPQVCYDQVALEAFPHAVRTALMNVAVGQNSQPIQTANGYEVFRIVSRVEQGFTPEVEQVLAAAITTAQRGTNAAFTQLTGSARVKVNPAYGSWQSGQVAPPTLST